MGLGADTRLLVLVPPLPGPGQTSYLLLARDKTEMPVEALRHLIAIQ